MNSLLPKSRTSTVTVLWGGGVISGSLAVAQAPPWMLLVLAVGVLLLAGLVAIVQGAIPQESQDRVSFWKDFWKHWTTKRRDTLANRQRKVKITVVAPTPRVRIEPRRRGLHLRHAGIPTSLFTAEPSGADGPRLRSASGDDLDHARAGVRTAKPTANQP